MKLKNQLSALATSSVALLIAGTAFAQTTVTSGSFGYTSETLKGGQFNLMGLTVHGDVVAAGDIDVVSGTSITDNDIDFDGPNGNDGPLIPGCTYILEIADGVLLGAVQQITAPADVADGVLTTPDDLQAAGLLVGAKYRIRKAKTIADVFGAANESGLLGSVNAAPSESDIIYIPATLGFKRIFYSSFGNPGDAFYGWLDASDFTPAGTTPLIYTDGILVERKPGADITLVMFGAVKSSSASLLIDRNFTYLGGVFPVGSTLDTSGLENSIQGSANASPAEADLLYLPNGTGGFDKFFFSTFGNPGDAFYGWLNAATFSQAGTQPLTSGMIIEKKGVSNYSALIDPPAYYNQ